MAKYTGSISLVDVSDMISTSGVGISHSEVLYAVSNTSSTPPDLDCQLQFCVFHKYIN